MMAIARKWLAHHRTDLICILVIIGLATAFMHRWLMPGYTSLPLNMESAIKPWQGQIHEPAQNLLVSDPFYIFYPIRHFLTESLQHGSLPLWNPYILGGHPSLGDTNAPTFYPPNLLAALFLSPERALPILAWLHVILSGILMYVFLRVLDLLPQASLLGAVTWMFGTFTVVWLETPHFISTLAWIPGLFACFEMALRRSSAIWVALGGLLLGLEILGGQTQLALYSVLLFGLYALFHSLYRSWQRGRLVVRPFLILVAIGMVGIGVGAVQLLPTFQLVGLSHRNELTIEEWLSTNWPLRQAVTLWLPDYLGNALRFDYRGVQNFAETAAYFGVVPFVLSLVAVFISRHRVKWFAVGLFIFILLVAGGTWLASALAWLPGMRYFNLSRLAGLLAFAGSILAAIAVQTLVNSPRPKSVAIGLGVALGLMIVITGWVILADLKDALQYTAIIQSDVLRTLALIGLAATAIVVTLKQPRVGAVALVILVFVDLYQWGEPFNPVYPTSILYPENDVSSWLRQDTSIYRVLPLKAGYPIFGPNVPSVFGISEVGGYTSLTVRRYQELLNAIDPQVQLGNAVLIEYFNHLYGILNVKYVLSTHDLPTTAVLVNQQGGCSQQSEPLVGDQYFEQSFVVPDYGFNRLDLMLASVGQGSDQPIRFRLWRGNASGELLADIETPLTDIVDRGFSTYFFAPVPDSKGDQFTWRIEAPGAHSQETVALCLNGSTSNPRASFIAYGVLLQQMAVQQGVWIYQNLNALPRAYLVHHAISTPTGDDLAAMRSPSFNMFRSVVLEMPLPADQAELLSSQPIQSRGQVSITRYEADRVDIKVQADLPGILVLSDVDYPGWEVSVDGTPESILRVNHALRGVFLSAGTHSVAFTFRPSVFLIGLGVTSLASLSIVVIASIAVLQRHRSKPMQRKS